MLLSPLVSQDMGLFVSKLKIEDPNTLGAMIKSGALTPVIDRP
jgi:hypothetical protein